MELFSWKDANDYIRVDTATSENLTNFNDDYLFERCNLDEMPE